ncbi:protein brambleberry-like [Leptosomus discolor]
MRTPTPSCCPGAEEVEVPPEVGTPPEVGNPLCVPFEVTTDDDQFRGADATRWDLSPLDSCDRQVVVPLCSSCTNLSEEEKAAKLGVDLLNCQAEGCRTYTCTLDVGQEEPQEQPAGWLRPRLETPDHHSPQQPVVDETLVAARQHRVAQLMEDTTHQEGNVSSRGATGHWEGHRVVLSDLHQAQERAQDVYSQLESNLALLLAQQRQMEEVMEKLWRVNQSLELTLEAVEGARSWLENHLQHLHAALDPAGRTPSAISTFILHGSYLVLLVALLVPTPPRAILLLLFLASSALSELLGIPALSALLALAVAGQWLVVAARRGAGGAWVVLPREKPHHWLTSTPDRECEVELLQEELDKMEISSLRECPQAMLGHVHHPKVSPSNTWGRQRWECVTTRVLAEPSCLEQPTAMAGDVPGLAGWVSPIPSGWRTKLSSCGVMLEPAMGGGKHWEPKPYSPSQSLASDTSLLSPRSLCQGLTRAGQRCRKKAIPGQDFCHIHATG